MGATTHCRECGRKLPEHTDPHPHTKVHVGYNQCAVTAFSMEMLRQYA